MSIAIFSKKKHLKPFFFALHLSATQEYISNQVSKLLIKTPKDFFCSLSGIQEYLV